MAQLFILLLVFWPWGTPPIPRNMPAWYWRELGQFAVMAQLVERPEQEWRKNDARKQLAWVRQWLQVSRDWPSIYDVYRLPPIAMVQNGIAFNNAYRRHLGLLWAKDGTTIAQLNGLWSETQNPAYGLQLKGVRRHSELVQQKQNEAMHHLRIWIRMLEPRDAKFDLLERRRSLSELRALVGPRAYYWGDWPGCVPAQSVEPAAPTEELGSSLHVTNR